MTPIQRLVHELNEADSVDEIDLESTNEDLAKVGITTKIIVGFNQQWMVAAALTIDGRFRRELLDVESNRLFVKIIVEARDKLINTAAKNQTNSKIAGAVLIGIQPNF
jgi:hypothetical protein